MVCSSWLPLLGQTTFKPHLKDVNTERESQTRLENLAPLKGLPLSVPKATSPFGYSLETVLGDARSLAPAGFSGDFEKWVADPKTGLPVFIKGDLGLPVDFSRSERAIQSQAEVYLGELTPMLRIENTREEFVFREMQVDDLGMEHLRYDQFFQGVKVYGGEVILHRKNGKIEIFNGRFFPTPKLQNTRPGIPESEAIDLALDHVNQFTPVQDLSALTGSWIQGGTHEAELVVYHLQGDPRQEYLAWSVEIQPNLGNRWKYFIDAQTGTVLNHFNTVCQLHPHPEKTVHAAAPVPDVHSLPETPPLSAELAPFDGPGTATATDLNNESRTVNTYELNGTYFFVDVSRPMFNASQSTLPNDGVGVILTGDAQNASPQDGDEFQPIHITSPNNNWDNPIGVSAHANAGVAYEYFRQTFGRNSINGQGGNVISFINVSESGQPMDNAFWNGFAMFYGNGNQAFRPLAGALDVAGHEISHGVIQNTANLEYQGESGALNESFADVFGVMIDREDFLLGEDVVLPQAFPSGALRNMEDPNQGGSSLADPGFQPANTSEQFRGEANNGGVHINSGIANRAFVIFSQQVGKDLAEQVYYRALTTYLTRTSQFIDMRAAIEQAASDLGNNATVQAASNAFATVGIGTGGGVNEESEDVEINPGISFVLIVNLLTGGLDLTDDQGNIITTSGLTNTAPLFKPSVTDDGRAAVFVDSDKTIKAIFFDWELGEFRIEDISTDQVWRNAAISRDGQRLAAITEDFDNLIYVFDLSQQPAVGQIFELFNPTTAQGGISTGDVQYAEALEWDFSGNFVMYDALNRINSGFGQLEYWDIGFLRAWNSDAGDFSDGNIFKLFTGLPEDVSIGNPTFAKNSPFIIALDYLDGNNNENLILGVNLETLDQGVLSSNNTIGFPSYLSDDSGIIFDFNDQGSDIIAIRAIQDDKINGNGDLFRFVDNAFWGTWFSNGTRLLTSTRERNRLSSQLAVFPNPFRHDFQVDFESDRAGQAQVELFDLMGKRLLQQNELLSSGKNRFSVDAMNLPSGTYWLRITVGSETGVQQIVKTN